jgi:hypothetical protein
MPLRLAKAIKLTEEETNELKDAQGVARDEILLRYAQQHPAKVLGQVVVDGKLFATVYETGTTTAQNVIPGLPDDGGGSRLAEARLAYIAKATGGEIIRSEFSPTPEGSYWDAPDSLLPSASVVRGFAERLHDALMRSQIEAET